MASLQDFLNEYEAELNTQQPAKPRTFDLSRFNETAPAATPKATSGKWSDLAVTGAKGVIGAGEALVGLANLPTMGYAGKALEGIGYRPAEAKAALDEQYSPYRQELNKGLAETKGFLPTLGYMAQNPSTIGHAIVESIPATVGGGVIGRGVGALAPKLGFGVRAGIGEGAVIAGGTAESVRQQTEDGTLSAGQVGASLAAGAIGGLIGAKGAKVAKRFGLPDVDVALVGGSVKDALKPGYLKRVGTAALVEGVFEELPQSAQEQVFQNVALGRPFADGVAEAAAQGMMAGMGMGAGFAATQIRQKPAGQITDDDLKSGVDEALAPPAPPAAPTEPMQAEYEQAQREFAVANQPQGDQFPGLRETPTEELQRMSALLAADKGKTIAGAKEIELAIAQELAARAPQPETLAQKNDRLIAEAMAPQPVAPEVDPLIAVQERAQREFEIANRPRDTRYPTLREASTEELQELAARLASKEGQKVAGRKAAQEAIAQELAARAPQPETLAQRMDQKIAANVSAMTEPYDIPVPDRVRAVNEGRDLFGNVQEAAPTTAPSRQTEALLSELGQIEQSIVDGTATPRDVVRMQQVRDMLGQETRPVPTAQSAAPLIDQVPKKILRGQDRARLAKAPVEELPARIYEMWAAKGGANSSGLLAPELDRLYAQVTGQRIQDYPNVVAGQTTQALKAGMQAARTQGRIENVQGSLAAVPILTKQARMKALRATQASVEAGQQPAAMLGRNIPEAPDAVQEPVTKGVDVRQPAENGEKMAKGNAQGNAPAAKGPAKGKVDVPVTPVAKSRPASASDNTGSGTGTGGTAGTGAGGRVRGRAGTPAASDRAAVAVGDTASEPATDLRTPDQVIDVMEAKAGKPFSNVRRAMLRAQIEKEGVAAVEAPTKESPYAKKKERESELRDYIAAYEELKKPADMPLSKFKKTRIAYLTSIAEVEANADTGTSKAAARKYLEGIPDKDEVAQARRAAATTVKNVSEVEAKLAAREAAIEKRTAAWEAQLADMDGKGKKPSASDKKLARHLAEYAEDGKPFFSVGSAAKGDGMSVKAVRSLLQGLFNSPTRFDALINVVENETELPLKMLKALKTVENGAVGGFFNPESGKVWIIANNMANEREAQAVFLHEVGVHMGMRNLLGKQNYDKLIDQLDVWEKAGTGVEGKLAKKATQRAAQAEAAAKQTPNVERFNEERLAYFVEEAVLAGIDPTAIATQPKSLQAWFRRLWQSLQTAMRKLGIAPNSLQASDVVDLAYGSAYITLDSENIDVTAATPDQEAGIKYSISSPTTLKTLTDYKAATDAAKGLADKVSKTKLADMKLSTFQMVIPWLTKHHLISQFDKWLGGGLAMNGKADSIQETMTTRMNQLFNEPHQRFLAIERADKERAKKITELMQATEFQIDPRKSWDKHTHLHDLTGWQLQQAKDFVAQYGQIWGKMNAEDRQVYNDLATMNQTMYTAELALGLYNMARANPSAKDLPAFQADPSEQFRESTTTHGSIKAAQDYWRGVMDKYTAALDQHVAQQRGLLPQKAEADPEYQSMVKSVLRGIQSEKAKQLVRRALRTKEDKDLSDEQKKIARHLSPLEAQMRMVNETAATFEHAPYFHLGRFGDHFVSFRVRTGEDNLADPAAMIHVQAALAKAFPKITIRSDATDPHVFARFESVGEQQEFEKAVREMQKQGWLMQPGVKDEKNNDLGEILSGSRNDVISGYHTAGPNWLTRVVESIQAEGYDDAVEEHMISHVRSLYLDSLPDNAAIKVKQKREGRPGWDADMMRSYAHRMRIGSNRVGSLAAEPTRTQSFAVMKDAQKQSQTNPDLSAPRRGQIAAVVSEFERRNSDQMSVPNTPAIDKLRALNHAYFLGMSPSYVLIQMTQLGVLTWPELAKKNGFVKSAKAVAEVTPIALKVMGTVIKEGYTQRGVKGAADMVVTSEMLEKAGVSEADADFIIKVMAAGKIDIGNAAREIGRVAEGETGSEALKIASSFGYASETVTRITTALASKRLYDAKPANQKPSSDPVKYAIEVIDESMLNYTSTNIGRMTGKQGVASTWTPVMFSFLQYQFQLLEKMYREFYNAYTSDPALSKEEREAKQKEARRFLGSHMFSMLTLAGTLGLPFATAIAAAADKLCGMFSDDYCDSKAALRNMTSEVFGRDIEPLVSKGLLSRALGFDISERAGEGNLLPFSKFLADKRKMEDALKDLAWSSWGAPSSMIAGIYKGYERMADGDMIGGMQEAVPLALKGPIKAFTMSEKGYTDNAGNVLPMTPGAFDIMLQAIGLNPGEKADYQQAKFMQSQRKGVLTREGTMIRQKLASAIERQDTSDMRKWMAKAQEFDSTNPTRAILPTIGSVITQRARAQSMAKATGMTLGVAPDDFAALRLTAFMQQ